MNDFLRPAWRRVTSFHVVTGHPAVKDLIEGLGVPHPEVELVLANGTSVPFDYAVQDADRIAVFPQFTTIDIGTVSCVRPPPLGTMRFVLDVHLGKLAKHLRLIGLDAVYRADAHDRDLADVASREGRILLTRDVGLLKRRMVSHGYFVRNTHPRRQLVEVLRRFDLELAPFSRCLRCNTELRAASKAAVESSLQPQTRRYYDRFQECTGCGRIYWKGSHWKRLISVIESALQEANRVDSNATQSQ